jgi:superfamily II DNA or RNA helicase
MLTDLIADRSRNALIEREVRARLSGSQALILTDRIEHANILARQLADLQPVLLTGDLSKSERAQNMLRVRHGAALTIATIHLLGEGVDVPGWDLLFLVSPIAGGPRTLQAVGRVARPAPGKSRATVIDFVDSRVPFLANAARSRQRLYHRDDPPAEAARLHEIIQVRRDAGPVPVRLPNSSGAASELGAPGPRPEVRP